MREYSTLDQLIAHLDQGLRTVAGRPDRQRATPRAEQADADMGDSERAFVGSLMRVNHSGEICAQALYHGQALTARSAKVRNAMQQAAADENDHLAWCEERIDELGTHKSYLNPLWYLGSFSLGAAAGLVGDRWSLGFLAETERQVVRHLEGHLNRLPLADKQSRVILQQMRDDEAKHASTAVKVGAAELPELAKKTMAVAAKLMTTVAARF